MASALHDFMNGGEEFIHASTSQGVSLVTLSNTIVVMGDKLERAMTATAERHAYLTSRVEQLWAVVEEKTTGTDGHLGTLLDSTSNVTSAVTALTRAQGEVSARLSVLERITGTLIEIASRSSTATARCLETTSRAVIASRPHSNPHDEPGNFLTAVAIMLVASFVGYGLYLFTRWLLSTTVDTERGVKPSSLVQALESRTDWHTLSILVDSMKATPLTFSPGHSLRFTRVQSTYGRASLRLAVDGGKAEKYYWRSIGYDILVLHDGDSDRKLLQARGPWMDGRPSALAFWSIDGLYSADEPRE